MDYKIIIGLLATILAFVSYIPYFRSLLAGKTKPHIFSWIVWTTIVGISFAAQLTQGAGAGAWASGLTTILSTTITIIAIKKGKFDITLLDWISMAGAFIALTLWVITKGPLLSVIFGTLTDALGFVPTIRKALKHPHEETLSMFALSGVKHALILVALERFTFITAFYSSYLVVANAIFVSLVLFKRKSAATPHI